MNDLSHTHMRAAVWHGRNDIRVEQVPLPADPAPGWVQIKVDWCGICGSDLHEYVAGPVFIPVEKPHPLTGIQGQCILGHEFCGEIVKLGAGVEGFSAGEVVAADACQHCGTCYYCTHGLYNICERLAFTGLMNNGAFAELVNVPANLLYALPANFPAEAGALIEPLAVGLGVSQQPLILQFAPDWLKNLLSSGIAAGGITAIVLNLIFPPEKA